MKKYLTSENCNINMQGCVSLQHPIAEICDLIIPEKINGISVTEICCDCYSFGQMSTISFPKTLLKIGHSTFSNCPNLISLTIPKNVKYIGRCAFAGCKSLKDVIIENKIDYFGISIFSECKSLTKVTFPYNTKSISNYTFRQCSKLLSINYTGTIKEWDSVKLEPFWNNYTLISKIHCIDGDIKI